MGIMDYDSMNENFNNDLKGFECELKVFLEKRKIALFMLAITIGFIIGILTELNLSNSLQIDNLTLTIYAIVISVIIGIVSMFLGWDSQKRGDFGMEYSELRFNYVMQYIKIVDDKISSLNKILEDNILTLKKP